MSRLSRRDRTVILSIHQPRYTIFKLFDRLSLMAAGRCAFHGQASQALPFFVSLGLLHDTFFYRTTLLQCALHAVALVGMLPSF